jgi:hypothetical protein
MTELHQYLRGKAAEAENSLRLRYTTRAAALPERIEHELARLARADTPDAALARYEYARRELRDVDHPRGAPAATDAALVMDLLVQRVPLNLTLTNGRVVGITSKSLAWMRRSADLWAGYVALSQAAEPVRSRARLSDLPLLRRVDGARHRLLRRILALAIHPAAHPADPGDPPGWLDELTPEDIEAIQAALLVAGEARLAALPDPEPAAGNDGEAKSDPVRSSFGSFLARVAKQRGVPVDAVMEEDFARLIAELRATADQPSREEADLFGS